ncbi:MAG TPA: hypothetical protein VI704_07980 [Bacteroidota bacterium]|nr:hypothetical protein [Bacteroidota bacterium]
MTINRKKNLKSFFFVVFAFVGCAGRPTTEERLLEQAFDAIKNDDWDAYNSLTITFADFLLKAQNINMFNEKNSYAGGVLKPEQLRQQQEEFQIAVEGGPAFIDFRNSDFVSSGNVVHSGSLEALDGPDIPYKIFSVRVNIAGSPSSFSYPRFMVVPWNKEFRIMKLEFPAPVAKK